MRDKNFGKSFTPKPDPSKTPVLSEDNTTEILAVAAKLNANPSGILNAFVNYARARIESVSIENRFAMLEAMAMERAQQEAAAAKEKPPEEPGEDPEAFRERMKKEGQA